MVSRAFRVLLFKAYFDKGLGLTNYIKYFIAFFGLASANVKYTMIIALIYGILCYVLGRVWYYYNLVEVENEVANRYNPFVKEVRRKL